jgi:hypothetical protein
MCHHLDLHRIPLSLYLPRFMHNNDDQVKLAPSKCPRPFPGLGDPKTFFFPPSGGLSKRAVWYGRRARSLGETLHGHLLMQVLAKTQMWLAELLSFFFFCSCRGVHTVVNFVSGEIIFSLVTPQYIAIEDPWSAWSQMGTPDSGYLKITQAPRLLDSSERGIGENMGTLTFIPHLSSAPAARSGLSQRLTQLSKSIGYRAK